MSHTKSCHFVSLISALMLMATLSIPKSVRAAGPWYVSTTGNNSNSCTSTGSPCLTINGAITKAASGDTIKVAVGTYRGTGTEVVLINKSVTLSGGWNAGFTAQTGNSIVDGQSARRGVLLTNGVTASIDRFVIKNGFVTSPGGGGIRIVYATLNLSNSIVDGNKANDCAGIDNDSSTLTITNSVITNNTSINYGGGICSHNYFGGSLNIINSTISFNQAERGSGILTGDAVVSIKNSTLNNNKAVGTIAAGSAIYSGYSDTEITGSSIIENLVSGTSSSNNVFGGGIMSENGILSVNNSTISGNMMTTQAGSIAYGGGIYNYRGAGGGGVLNINNATITDNQAANGGGVYNNNSDSYGSGAVEMKNTIVAKNTAATSPDCFGSIISTGYNLIGNNSSCAFSYTIGDLVGTSGTPINPHLTPLQNNSGPTLTHGLLASSMAINHGNPASPGSGGNACLATDQRGIARPVSAACDIGAFEGETTVNLAVIIQDPSFEAYTPNPYWSEFSTNFGTPLCVLAICGNGGGTGGPRTGSAWGWFGGTSDNETAILSQAITIPSGFPKLKLKFYFWIGAVEPGSDTADVFTAKIDGVTVFSANATQQGLYPAYTPILVDISAFDDDASHTITFSSLTTGQVVTYNLDDISLFDDSRTISGNAGVAGVTLSYTDATLKTVTANGSGNYSFTVPLGWSGTVTPSKTGYNFSPISRSYTNVTTNKTAQNYTAVLIRYTISGNVGASGITLNYTDGIARSAISQANGNYSFTVPYNWSGTVTPAPTCFTFTPISKNYVNVLANQTAQNYAAVFNAASGCSNISIDIGGNNQGSYGVAPQTSTRASFAQNNGPVKATSPNAVPFLIAERDAWLSNGVVQSFSEMMGLPANQVTDTYYFPWYNNVTMDTQLRFANLGVVPTDITVTIAGVPQPVIPLAAGVSTRVSYAGINNGPVKVQSSGGTPIIVAERDAWLINGVVQSFSEMMGLPGNQLTDIYYFPWYNNVTMDTQLRFANLGNTTTHITVTIAGIAQEPITVAAGQSTRVSYPGINNGPVKMQSTGGTPIIVAERDAWLINGVVRSFSEMMGLPGNQLTTTYHFPWYNNVTMDTQLRFANLGVAPTNITVTIAGIAQPVIPLAAGVSTRVSYAGINNGPVTVTSSGGVPIIVAERDAWLLNGVVRSFSEMMGLPGNQLTTTYYFPWYNNLTMDTQLRFAVP